MNYDEERQRQDDYDRRQHGASVVMAVPFNPKVVAQLLTWVDQKDPEFKVAAVMRETFEDGFTTINVVYWMSDPTPQPPAPKNQPVKKLPPLTRVAKYDGEMDLQLQ